MDLPAPLTVPMGADRIQIGDHLMIDDCGYIVQGCYLSSFSPDIIQMHLRGPRGLVSHSVTRAAVLDVIR